MKGYGIYVKNNLLEPKHINTMGSSIWLYLWLLDKVTTIDSRGIGKVLGGKPIKHGDIEKDLGMSERSYTRYVKILRDGGYIQVTRTPYGLAIRVTKTMKIFNNKTKTDTPKMADQNKKEIRQKVQRDTPNVAYQKQKMADLIKTKQLDNTKDNTIKEKKVKPEMKETSLITNQLKPKQKRDGNIDELIDFFHDRFDLKMKRMSYQRIAASNLIKRYEKFNVLKAIDAAAIVRTERYAPQILSLEDLWDKWDKLAAFYKRNQPKSTNMNLDNMA